MCNIYILNENLVNPKIVLVFDTIVPTINNYNTNHVAICPHRCIRQKFKFVESNTQPNLSFLPLYFFQATAFLRSFLVLQCRCSYKKTCILSRSSIRLCGKEQRASNKKKIFVNGLTKNIEEFFNLADEDEASSYQKKYYTLGKHFANAEKMVATSWACQ